ncbi:MAG TPA: hypothetical protein PK253_00170 [Spirochaetota bacterium]|nr:hypothetical protein [Spirochaetota bacterium]
MWSSKTTIFDMPLFSAGFYARGFIAVGFSGVGIITIAQFGVGIISITQFGIGIFSVAQFALGFFTLAQVSLGVILAVGQGAVGFAAVGFDGATGFVIEKNPKSIVDGILAVYYTIMADPVFFLLWSSCWTTAFLFFFIQKDKFSGKWKLRDFFVPRIHHTSPGVRTKALKKISSPDELLRIIRTDMDTDVRKTAFNKIDDEKLILKIMLDPACTEIHGIAISKIQSEALLLEIALKSENPDIADTVIERIQRQDYLMEITKNAKRSRFRGAALVRLTSPDEKYLHEIALTDSSKNVLLPLISMTTRQDTLLHILQKSGSPDIRLAAAKKLTPDNQVTAAELIMKEKDSAVIKNLAGIISDRGLLKKIASKAESTTAKTAAILCLKDDDTPFLLEVLKTSTDKKILEAALVPVTDQNILGDIVLGKYGSAVSLQAVGKIDNRETLEHILSHTDNEKVRQVAKARIKSVMPVYYRFTVEFDCPSCSHPVFLNGPLLKTQCSYCLQWAELDTGFWKTVLHSGLGIERYLTFHDLIIERTDHHPECTSCGELLPSDDIPEEYDGHITCSQCGEKNAVFPLPESFRWINNGELVFCGERQGEAEKAAAEMKPVAISCIKCGGPLTVTVETPRNATCTYCDTLQYLPDGLWLSLHPVKTKHPWFIRMNYHERKNLTALKKK